MKTETDYMKLQQDIRAALAAGAAMESRHTEEGRDFGMWNLDSAILILPARDGWDANRAKSAADAAGAQCSLLEPARRDRDAELNLAPRTNSQSSPRSINAAAISKALQDAGYDSHVRFERDHRVCGWQYW